MSEHASMFTRIVVGWDDSPDADAAVRWAAERGVGIPVVLVHAIGGTDTSSEYLQATGERSEQRVRLMEVADRLRAERPDLQLTTSTEHGSPSTVLAEYLDEGTLVVVGAPAQHQGSRWTVGSRLAGRRGGGTVAVIPSTPTTNTRSAVVVGVDGSSASMAGLGVAASEARRLGGDLEVVHAWTVPASWNAGNDAYSADVAYLEDMHSNLLDDAVGFAQSLGARATGRLERGDAVDVLTRAGSTAGLVVVGSQGGGPLARVLLGSVSHGLLISLPAPTMVVGPAD